MFRYRKLFFYVQTKAGELCEAFLWYVSEPGLNLQVLLHITVGRVVQVHYTWDKTERRGRVRNMTQGRRGGTNAFKPQQYPLITEFIPLNRRH